MRTNIDLNDELVVEQALKAFIESHQRRDIRELHHIIKLDPTYEYKKLRQDS